MKTTRYVLLILILCIIFTCCFACKDDANTLVKDNGVTLNFYVNNTVFETITYNSSSFVLPFPPIIDDYDFGGWYLDTDFEIPFDQGLISTYTKDNVVNVYARYMPTHNETELLTITYIVDGVTNTMQVRKGEVFIMPDDPTKQGYSFGGWYLDTDFSIPFDDEKAQTNGIRENITIYSKFIEDFTTITMYVDDSILDELIVKNSALPTALPTAYKDEKHVFHHWQVRGTDETFDLGDYLDSTPRMDVELDAVFLRSSVDVILDINGNITTIDLPLGESLDLSQYTPQNTLTHDFAHWKMNDTTFSEEMLLTYNNDIYRSDLHLTAEFEEHITYVSFFLDNTLIARTSVTSDLVIDYPNLPPQDGELFLRWNIIDNDIITPFDADRYLSTIGRGDIELHAELEPIKSIFNFYVDSALYHSQNVGAHHLLNSPIAPTKIGYNFAGWTCNGKPFDIDAYNQLISKDSTIASSYDVHATFTPVSTHIQLIGLDGIEQENILYTTDLNIAIPEGKPIEGYTFIGWYTDITQGDLFDLTAYNNTPNRTNITLYARYEKLS